MSMLKNILRKCSLLFISFFLFTAFLFQKSAIILFNPFQNCNNERREKSHQHQHRHFFFIVVVSTIFKMYSTYNNTHLPPPWLERRTNSQFSFQGFSSFLTFLVVVLSNFHVFFVFSTAVLLLFVGGILVFLRTKKKEEKSMERRKTGS